MINNFLQKITKLFNRLIEARQESVNRDVARYLMKEYPGESYDYIVHKLNTGKLDELVK